MLCMRYHGLAIIDLTLGYIWLDSLAISLVNKRVSARNKANFCTSLHRYEKTHMKCTLLGSCHSNQNNSVVQKHIFSSLLVSLTTSTPFPRVTIRISLSIRDVRRKPVQTFVEAFTRCCASRLNEPVALAADGVESKLISYFCGSHCIRQILFVGKN